ncbi:MAG: exosortase C-terminal domain/associated protein EpsI, partial [Gemmatimonadaceae bacterium]
AAAGLVTYAWGLRQLLAWWLPVTLVLLALPLPEVVLSTIALPLQMQASQLGAAMLESRHVPVVLSGNVIRIPGHNLFVTEACSGLRSLAALLSLGVLLGGVMTRHVVTRMAIVALAVPIAILLNGVRVFLSGYLILFVSPATAEGFMHATEGWLMFVVAFAVLAAVTWAAVALERRLGGNGRERGARGARRARGSGGARGAALSAARGWRSQRAAGASSLGQSLTPSGLRALAPAAMMAAGSVLVNLAGGQAAVRLQAPLATMPLTLAGHTGVERPISPEEQRVAGMSDHVFRVFARDSALLFTVYVGYYESQATGKTIHSPRNCLPGAGWQQVQSGRANLTLNGAPVTVNRYLLANGQEQALVYYWYQGRGRVAWSEYAVKWDLLRDAARHGRTEEALVRVLVPLVPAQLGPGADPLRSADELATAVAQELIPRVQRMLPPWLAGAAQTASAAMGRTPQTASAAMERAPQTAWPAMERAPRTAWPTMERAPL